MVLIFIFSMRGYPLIENEKIITYFINTRLEYIKTQEKQKFITVIKKLQNMFFRFYNKCWGAEKASQHFFVLWHKKESINSLDLVK